MTAENNNHESFILGQLRDNSDYEEWWEGVENIERSWRFLEYIFDRGRYLKGKIVRN